MGTLVITGGKRLEGVVVVEGAKNSVLPILSATVLNSGKSVIKNCPKLKDVEATIDILRHIGCTVIEDGSTLEIDSSSVSNLKILLKLAGKMRSSTVFMGSMLSRFREVIISYPGGCEIGHRPIDMHIEAFKKMGVVVDHIQQGYIHCRADKLEGCDINLDYPSVGATENIMLAAVFAEGTTYIRNAAKEPEISDLQDYLRSIGVKISGAGSSVITIEGEDRKKKLSSVEHTIIPDRIVAGTYMAAGGITGGDVTVEGVKACHLDSVISKFIAVGCEVEIGKDFIRVRGPKVFKPADIIRTLPYPGFPTDMQAQFSSMLTVAKGTSIVEETVFENRYKYVDELLKMGANIKIYGSLAVIKGVKHLTGTSVSAKDLRGGAALILGGLVAEGETLLSGLEHIDRGYENIQEKLASIGADVIMKSKKE